MMANESIDVAAFDFDDGGSEAKRIQMNFAITNLPAILFFPGERRDPAKMSTLDRNIVTDREVTPEEIVEWSKSQVGQGKGICLSGSPSSNGPWECSVVE